jgi:hypothetical protein
MDISMTNNNYKRRAKTCTRYSRNNKRYMNKELAHLGKNDGELFKLTYSVEEAAIAGY